MAKETYLEEKHLIALNLPNPEAGYYSLNDNIKINIDGYMFFEHEDLEDSVFIGECHTLEGVKKLIEFLGTNEEN